MKKKYSLVLISFLGFGWSGIGQTEESFRHYADSSQDFIGRNWANVSPSEIINASYSTKHTASLTSRHETKELTKRKLNTQRSDNALYPMTKSGQSLFSNLSTIVDNTNYSTTAPEFNSRPEYINFTDASSSSVGKFIPMKLKIIDGPDADDLATTLTDLRLTVEDLSNTNQLAMIKTAVLTGTGGTVIATATKIGNELAFSGMSGPLVTAADDDATGKIVHLRVSFDETQVIDRTKLVFKITSATADPSGSSFATIDAGGAQTDAGNNNRNRLNVTADRLYFETQPSDAFVGINISPSPVVHLTDLYGHIDLDVTSGTITMTSTGIPNTQPSAIISSGQAIFDNLIHNTVGGPFVLTASYTGWSTISSDFNINNIPNGSYRTTGTGNWQDHSATPAIWERFDGILWQTSNAPGYNTSEKVFIRSGHVITSNGSFGNTIALTVLGNGTFNVNHPGTFGDLTINSGGNVNINANLSIHPTGSLVVEDRGNLTVNYRYGNPTTSLWAGTENFHPDSNLILKNWDESDILLQDNTTINTNTYRLYSAAFGNIICDFGENLDSNDAIEFLASGININLAHGDLIFRSNTAANSDMQISTTGTVTSGIGGDFIVAGTYPESQKINFKTSDDLNFTIKGNLTLEAATTAIAAGATVNSSITIEGNLDITQNAELQFNPTVASGASATINLHGHLFVGRNALLQNTNSNNHGIFNFSGIGDGLTPETIQTIDVASTNSNENRYIAFHIKNNAFVKLINGDFELGRNSSLVVQTGGVLDFGFNGTTALDVTISGSQSGTTFISQQGSTLKITSPNGITTTTNLGNVKTVPSNRSFSQTATFHYIGMENQATGNAILTGSTGKIVYVNLIDNSKTLTLTRNIGISEGTALDADGGKLEINQGTVIGSNFGDFYGSGRLVMTDGEYRISTITAAPMSSYLPQLGSLPGNSSLGGYGNYVITGGAIHLNGNNAIQILSGVPTYYNLSFSGTNDLRNSSLPYNYKGISKAVNVRNTIAISENAIVDVENKTFGGEFTNLVMQDNAWYVTAGSGIKPDAYLGNYVFGPHTTIEFNNNSGFESIRLINPIPLYANIVVSGSHVGTTATGSGPGQNSFIQFQAGGSLKVTETGTFKHANINGFSGLPNSSISNINNPSITLFNGSTVEYHGSTQTISPFAPGYKNLTLSGTGTKSLGHPTDVMIDERLNVNASSLLIKTDEVINVKEGVHVDPSAQFNIENSGSLIQIDDTKMNTGKISMIRKASIRNRDYVYWSSPITGYNVSNITATNHIYKWEATATNANNTQGNWIQATNEIMEIGKGYIVRAPNGYPDPTTPGELNFTTTFYSDDSGLGVANNGEIKITVSRGSNAISDHNTDDNWNFLGNPYPSAISILDFLSENTAVDGYVSLWKHGLPPTSNISPFYQNFALNYHQVDYFYYNSLGNSDGPSDFSGNIAAGQGFMTNMVDGEEPASATVTFKNSMRKAFANNQFFRTPQKLPSLVEKHRIWLDLLSPASPTNRMLVGYITGATIDKDRMFDARLSFESASEGIYSLINNKAYIIQGRPLPFDDTDVIPLGYKVSLPETYVIAIGAVDGLFESNDNVIYLRDKLKEVTHNLTNHPYSFYSDAGTFKDRFEILFKDLALSTEKNTLDAKNLTIIELAHGHVQFSVEQKLGITAVEIMDVLGRTICHLKGQNASETYDLSSLSQAVYIAKVQLSNGQIIVKRAIKRK